MEGATAAESADHGSDEEEAVDPRIQIELDNLNGASEVINHLEAQLDEATARFRSMMQEASIELKQVKKKLGRCVDKARPYFECKKLAREAQLRTQKAARQFQRANSLYEAAKETITLAEQRLLMEKDRPFDSAWQEMLNHATIKVFESEKEKAVSEAEHQKEASELANLDLKVTMYQRRYGSSITKARPYFDLKAKHEEILEEQKQQVQNLQTSIQAAKDNYRMSLQMLESISEEIHSKRRQKAGVNLQLPPREPGVGADSDGSCSELDINLDSEIGSMQSYTPDVSDHESSDTEEVPSHSTDVKASTSRHVRQGVLLGVPGLSYHHHPAHFAPVRSDPTIPRPYASYDSGCGSSHSGTGSVKSGSVLGERWSHEEADGVSVQEDYLPEEYDTLGNCSRSRSNTLVEDEPATLEVSTYSQHSKT